MPDGEKYDLSTAVQDPDFMRASMTDKIAFLSAHDTDFASANLKDKMGYLNHIMGQGDKPDTRSTYQKLTSATVDPSISNPVARFAAQLGGAVIGAPEAIGKTLQAGFNQGSVSDAARALGGLNLQDYGKASTYKGAPSVLPEALGVGAGNAVAGELTGAALQGAAKIPNMPNVRSVAADAIVDSMGNPKPVARLFLGKDRAQAAGEILKPEIAERQGAQEIRAAKDEMYNDLAQRVQTRGVEQEKLDNMFSQRLKDIEDARQKELADWEKLRNQNAESLMRRAKEQAGIDKANDLFEQGRQEFLAKKAGFPKPLNPLIATPEEFAAYQQQMRILQQQAHDAGLYHAAQGSASKTTNLQQRIGRKFTE